ncbi:MAG TPA: hypothetical protein VKD72_06255 [Gemmataceae bacterium]|nr:hypothetical protein [Gemmataceae bacterium]
MNNGHRNQKGHFTVGNPGGPGRPRRTVERDYLAALSEAVTLDDWQEIVQAAVAAAKQGDGKARDWLCRYLIGEKPLTLTDLAADEATALGADQDILERMAKRQKDRDFLETFDGREMDQARKQLQRVAD